MSMADMGATSTGIDSFFPVTVHASPQLCYVYIALHAADRHSKGFELCVMIRLTTGMG